MNGASMLNPFRPGAGRVPPELAGRGRLLSSLGSTLDQVAEGGLGDRPIILSGLRGVGKTVLLNEIVKSRSVLAPWVPIKLEASDTRPLAVLLARELHLALRRTVGAGRHVRERLTRALRVFRSFQVTVDPSGTYGFGFDVEPERGFADSGALDRDLEDLLRELGEAFRGLGLALLIAIDELQEAPRADLTALNLALHTIGQDVQPVPVQFIGAGLPSLPGVLADATSYAERMYDFRRVDVLTDEQTQFALVAPATRAGITWELAGLNAAIQATGGYPYFVQAAGKHIWDARSESDAIRLDDVQTGLQLARDEVDNGLYQSRWERASGRQRSILVAMAEDGDLPTAFADIVTRTDQKSANLSKPRDELIRNGIVYASERGYLAFTVPGMADFINRTKKP